MHGTRSLIAGEFWAVHSHPRRGIVWQFRRPNGVTLQGANYLLAAAFKNGPKITAWRIGLIAHAGFAGVSEEDTNGSHPDWGEYTGIAARPLWLVNAPVSGQVTPSASAVIPITLTGNIRGAFLSDRAPVGDTSSGGTLYCTAVADAAYPVLAGGSVTVGYTVRARNP